MFHNTTKISNPTYQMYPPTKPKKILSEELIRAVEKLLFKDFLEESLHIALVKYMESRYKDIQTIVLYQQSENFCQFLFEHPGFPDIGNAEVIINKYGGLRYTYDYHYTPRPVKPADVLGI